MIFDTCMESMIMLREFQKHVDIAKTNILVWFGVWECPTTYDLHNALVGLHNISSILGKWTNEF
jgi:hypothetical protein